MLRGRQTRGLRCVEGPVRRPRTPCLIQRAHKPTWSAVSCLPLFWGGMCSSGSSLSIRRKTRSLSSGLPGRNPLDRRSSSLANAPYRCQAAGRLCRAFSSGPWQAKQFSERIGRTSPRRVDRAWLGVADFPAPDHLQAYRLHSTGDRQDQRESQAWFSFRASHVTHGIRVESPFAPRKDVLSRCERRHCNVLLNHAKSRTGRHAFPLAAAGAGRSSSDRPIM